MKAHYTLLYTTEQMRAWEDAAVAAGGSYAQLMENAGSRAAADLRARFDSPQHLLVLCGKGNNGGDGLVVARHWAQSGWPVTVCLLLGDTLSPLGAANLASLPPAVAVLPLHTRAEQLPQADIIMDAVFGTGYSGQLPKRVAAALQVVNGRQGCKVALDLPSGINANSGRVAANSFCADITYAFHAFKPAHRLPEAAGYCGETVCLNIE